MSDFHILDSLCGIPIQTSPLVPARTARETLSLDVTVSDSFRAEFNKWLLDFFGENEVVYAIGTQAIGGDSSIMMCNPEVMDILKRCLHD